jgi:hypothetical protein
MFFPHQSKKKHLDLTITSPVLTKCVCLSATAAPIRCLVELSLTKSENMSGIYLVAGADSRLRPTVGGIPHVTVAYLGKSNKGSAAQCCSAIMLECGDHGQMMDTGVPYVFDSVKINSFKADDGEQRHDVLLMLDKASAKRVTSSLDGLLDLSAESLRTTDMHMTLATFAQKRKADKYMAHLLETHVFPWRIRMVGMAVET